MKNSLGWIEAGIISIIALLAPIMTLIKAILVLIGLDLITGVIAALKRKEAITSAGFRRTVTKVFVYEMALIIAFIGEKYFIGDLAPLVKLISSMIGLVEIKSIFENLNVTSDNSFLKTILDKLNSINVQ